MPLPCPFRLRMMVVALALPLLPFAFLAKFFCDSPSERRVGLAVARVRFLPMTMVGCPRTRWLVGGALELPSSFFPCFFLLALLLPLFGTAAATAALLVKTMVVFFFAPASLALPLGVSASSTTSSALAMLNLLRMTRQR